MPTTVQCPGCSSRLNAPDAAAGKKVKCPKCQTLIVVPAPRPPAAGFEVVDDRTALKPARSKGPAAPAVEADVQLEDDPDDRPRKKRRKAAGPPPGVLIAAAAACVLLLAGAGFAVYWFGSRDKPQPTATAETNPGSEQPSGPPPTAPGVVQPSGLRRLAPGTVYESPDGVFRVTYPHPFRASPQLDPILAEYRTSGVFQEAADPRGDFVFFAGYLKFPAGADAKERRVIQILTMQHLVGPAAADNPELTGYEVRGRKWSAARCVEMRDGGELVTVVWTTAGKDHLYIVGGAGTAERQAEAHVHWCFDSYEVLK
jgi:hypothetical protein